MAEKLSPAERDAALSRLNGWSHDPALDSISKNLRFSSFSEAFGFLARVALLAETLDHHPELLNVFDKVRITLSTHSAKGLTAKDIALAAAIDAMLPS